jgi:hypothetical protein
MKVLGPKLRKRERQRSLYGRSPTFEKRCKVSGHGVVDLKQLPVAVPRQPAERCNQAPNLLQKILGPTLNGSKRRQPGPPVHELQLRKNAERVVVVVQKSVVVSVTLGGRPLGVRQKTARVSLEEHGAHLVSIDDRRIPPIPLIPVLASLLQRTDFPFSSASRSIITDPRG